MFAQLNAPSEQQWIILVVLGLAILLAVRLTRRSRPLDGSPKQYRRELDGAMRDTANLHRDLEALLRELNVVSAGINQRIESQFAKLERMTALAKHEAAQLRMLIQQSSNLRGDALPDGSERVQPAAPNARQLDILVTDEFEPDVSHANHEGALFARASLRAAELEAASEEADGMIERTSNANAPVDSGTAAAQRSIDDPVAEYHRQIHALADAGHSAMDIAEAIGSPVGEIDLILRLRQPLVRSRAG